MKLYLSAPRLVDTGDVYRASLVAEMETDNEQVLAKGMTVSFNGYGGAIWHSARRPNTRDLWVRSEFYAATWDQWGVLLSALFDLDPDMKVGSRKHPYYDGAEDFHRQTAGRFRGVRSLSDLPDYHGDHTFRFDPSLGGFTVHVSKCVKCSARQVRG